VRKTLNDLVAARVPLSYWRCYPSDSADQQQDPQRFDVDRDRNPELVACLAAANQPLKEEICSKKQ
jgi:hypothetical protein